MYIMYFHRMVAMFEEFTSEYAIRNIIVVNTFVHVNLNRYVSNITTIKSAVKMAKMFG